MGEPNTITAEFARFYKVNGAGRWQKKSPCGSYEQLKDRTALKRLQIATGKSLKRFE